MQLAALLVRCSLVYRLAFKCVLDPGGVCAAGLLADLALAWLAGLVAASFFRWDEMALRIFMVAEFQCRRNVLEWIGYHHCLVFVRYFPGFTAWGFAVGYTLCACPKDWLTSAVIAALYRRHSVKAIWASRTAKPVVTVARIISLSR